MIYSVDDEDDLETNRFSNTHISRNHQGAYYEEKSSVNVSTLTTLRKKVPQRDPPIQITVKDKQTSQKVQYEVTNYKRGCDTCKTIRLNQSVNADEPNQISRTSITKSFQNEYLSHRDLNKSLRNNEQRPSLPFQTNLKSENEGLLREISQQKAINLRQEDQPRNLESLQSEELSTQHALMTLSIDLHTLMASADFVNTQKSKVSHLQIQALTKSLKSIVSPSPKYGGLSLLDDLLLRVDQLQKDLSLQSIMHECELAKLKNDHKKEILQLERDFHLSQASLQTSKFEAPTKLEAEIKRLNAELLEREDDIEDLREAKRQFKNEIRARERKIEEMELMVERLERKQVNKQVGLGQETQTDDDERERIMREQIERLEEACRNYQGKLAERQQIQQEDTFLENQEITKREGNLLSEQFSQIQSKNSELEKKIEALESNQSELVNSIALKMQEINLKNQQISELLQSNEDLQEKQSKFELQSVKLQKLETLLQDSSEFQRLDQIIGELQSMIVLREPCNLTQDEKELIQEVFKVQPGGDEKYREEELLKLRRENSQLIENINEFKSQISELLKNQKEQLCQLTDFAMAIMSLSDKEIENNYKMTIAKRNKAPQYIQIEQQLSDVEMRLQQLAGEDVENQQQLVEVIEIGGETNILPPSPFKDVDCLTKPKELSAEKLNRNSFIKFKLPIPPSTMRGSRYQTQRLSAVSGRNHQRSSRVSKGSVDLCQSIIDDVVEDQDFLDQFLSIPKHPEGGKNVEIEIHDEEQTAPQSRNRVRDKKLKNGHSFVSRLDGRNSIIENVQSGYKRQTTANKTLNQSGLNFFGSKKMRLDEDLGFEIRVEKNQDVDFKQDLLQFIHCQALMLEQREETD